ncbi:hypothetical protein SDC9_164482 [bioreactor metagenome]|uniref:Uncharacterized protein n=1 Tax=bioreactor metagenome TaxID=1076179 RepID=A0A645FU10_9ZZZZ
MCRTDSFDGKRCQLFKGFLYSRTILAHNIGIVASHFIPEDFHIHVAVYETTVERTECSEPIAREKQSFRFVECHHRFRPMYHRCKVEPEFVITQIERISILDKQLMIRRDVVESFYHAECLLVTHNGYVGIVFFNQRYRT